jgi:hypothetical protein
MSATFTELFEAAKTAYLALLTDAGGTKQVQVGLRSYTYRDLNELQLVVEKLAVQAARESGTRVTILLADISGRA